MCSATNSPSHICYIIPPHIRKNLQEHKAENNSQCAFHDNTIRQSRKDTPRTVIHVSRTDSPLEITLHDCNHSKWLPGKFMFTNRDVKKDICATEAFNGAVETVNFFKDNFGRHSINGQGMPVRSSIHYDKNYSNAFWDGQRMVYGDGDGVTFHRFTIALDVIGHELAHGVTQFSADLEYEGQSGALNESISDVFGSMIKQRYLKQTAREADWLIGKELLMPGKGTALRSMAAPGTAYNNDDLGKDPQPSSMGGYVVTTDDDGGVHINSGIPNKAFYEAAVALDENSWEKLGKIWYTSLLESKSKFQFKDFADKTVDVAIRFFGKGGKEEAAVRKGWTVTEVYK